MLTIDTVLQERYRIIRPLGQGGMGAVYEAIDERIDKTVAIKEILLELENTSNKKQKNLIRKAFRREANSLVKARHEAVPDVTDYFSEFDREFLVMEFIEGDDLTRMLQKRKSPFTVEEVLPWINQLLEALNYLHNLKPPIIHRDIKPQNLKLNEWNKIKLLDFGVAKSNDKTTTITQMTFVGATLNYSPIEQILRVIDPMFRELILLKHKENAERVLAQNTDARCDIFALGATFYHLLTNYPPVDITKRTLETWEGKEDPLPNPKKINSELPTSISSWLIKAMSIERDDRFSSAVEMQKALDKATSLETERKKKEKVARIIEQANLRKKESEEKQKNQEQFLMQAKTERLIEIPEKIEAEKEDLSVTAPPKKAAESQKPDTFSSIEGTDTDFKITNTDIPLIDTSEELMDLSYDDEALKDQENAETEIKKAAILPPSKNEFKKSPAKNFNYVLIFSIIGILAFAVFGSGLLGFAIWINYSSAPEENESTIDAANANIVATPDATPFNEADIETNSDVGTETDYSESNTDTVDSKESTLEKRTPTPAKPASQPTRKPTVRPTPRRPVATPKPVTVKRTPRPTPTRKPKPKPTKDPNCIYTNSC